MSSRYNDLSWGKSARSLSTFIISSIFMIFLGTGTLRSGIASETITVSTGDWLPYVGLKGSDPPGYVIELVREIFTKAGYQVMVNDLPYERALAYLKDGRVDLVTAAFAEDLPSPGIAIFPDEEVGRLQRAFFVKKGEKWHYTGQTSLSQIKLGLVTGEVYPEIKTYLDQRPKPNRIEYVSGVDGYRRNVLKLLAGRIDAMLEIPEVVEFYAAQLHSLSEIRQAGRIGKLRKLWVAFSTHNPNARRYAKLFSEGIITMRKSGELQELLASYHVRDWKE
jgi:polar amino acid transport system substrate-binding protein